MNFNRVKYVLLESWYHTTHSMETWIDLFWFTIINLIIFGLIARLMAPNAPELGRILLIGYLLWETVRISQYCITVTIMWEVWSRCLSTLFVSPMTLLEYFTGLIISGVIKTLFVIGLLSVFCIFFFHFNLWDLGWSLLPYLIILMTFGISIGIFITGLVFRFNTDIQSLAWGLIYIFQPISAIYYPVEALPVQVRWLSYLSPISFVMQSVRQQLTTGEANVPYIGYGLIVVSIYLVFSCWFMKKLYNWAHQTGALARLGQ